MGALARDVRGGGDADAHRAQAADRRRGHPRRSCCTPSSRDAGASSRWRSRRLPRWSCCALFVRAWPIEWLGASADADCASRVTCRPPGAIANHLFGAHGVGRADHHLGGRGRRELVRDRVAAVGLRAVAPDRFPCDAVRVEHDYLCSRPAGGFLVARAATIRDQARAIRCLSSHAPCVCLPWILSASASSAAGVADGGRSRLHGAHGRDGLRLSAPERAGPARLARMERFMSRAAHPCVDRSDQPVTRTRPAAHRRRAPRRRAGHASQHPAHPRREGCSRSRPRSARRSRCRRRAPVRIEGRGHQDRRHPRHPRPRDPHVAPLARAAPRAAQASVARPARWRCHRPPSQNTHFLALSELGATLDHGREGYVLQTDACAAPTSSSTRLQ